MSRRRIDTKDQRVLDEALQLLHDLAPTRDELLALLDRCYEVEELDPQAHIRTLARKLETRLGLPPRPHAGEEAVLRARWRRQGTGVQRETSPPDEAHAEG